MALVVFLRGINVGGYRNFHPSLLAKRLRDFDVVNIGAAGTFVVRKPQSRAKFRAALLQNLPFAAHVALCDEGALLQLEQIHPFGERRPRPDITRFLSILTRPARLRPSLPLSVPAKGPSLVRILAAKPPFVLGTYRRDMRTIGYLGQLDQLFGTPVTTRSWNTILAIVRILKGEPAATLH